MFKVLPKANQPYKYSQILIKFCQSGEILPKSSHTALMDGNYKLHNIVQCNKKKKKKKKRRSEEEGTTQLA